MSDELNRRQTLKWIGSTLIGGRMLTAAGLRSPKPRETPSLEPHAPLGAQQPQDNPGVALQHKPIGNQYCGNCSLYVPDQNGDGFGACLTVQGKSPPSDWCILYTEHAGEGVASCAQA